MHRNESENPWIVHFCWHHLLCQPRKRGLHHFAMQSCVCLCKQCRVQRFCVYCSFFSFLYCKKSMNRIRCHCQVPVKCVSLLLVCSGLALSTTWLCTSSWMGKVMEHGPAWTKSIKTWVLIGAFAGLSSWSVIQGEPNGSEIDKLEAPWISAVIKDHTITIDINRSYRFI